MVPPAGNQGEQRRARLDSKSHERSYPTWTYGRGKVPIHGTRWRGQRWADREARVRHR
jgi:hypothetical protein